MASELQPVPRGEQNSNFIEWRQWFELLKNYINGLVGDYVTFSGRIKVGDNSETAVEGDVRYESTLKKHQGFDGTSWNNMY
mgnify:CR=1 FL=1